MVLLGIGNYYYVERDITLRYIYVCLSCLLRTASLYCFIKRRNERGFLFSVSRDAFKKILAFIEIDIMTARG